MFDIFTWETTETSIDYQNSRRVLYFPSADRLIAWSLQLSQGRVIVQFTDLHVFFFSEAFVFNLKKISVL